MNNSSYTGKSNRGFYAAVVFSVLAVIAAVVGISVTAGKIRSSSREQTQTSVDWDNHSAAVSDTEANKLETGIPYDEDENDEVEDDETEFTEEDSSAGESETESTGETAASVTTEKNIECSLPLGTAILKDYSNGTMVKSKTMNDWRTHNGVDFTGEAGDEGRAGCPGVVKRIENDSSWGNVITVEHDNGLTARYCGIDSVTVSEGETVGARDVLGTLGEIPIESADASHLHFEMMKDGGYVDPIEALSMQREEE